MGREIVAVGCDHRQQRNDSTRKGIVLIMLCMLLLYSISIMFGDDQDRLGLRGLKTNTKDDEASTLDATVMSYPTSDILSSPKSRKDRRKDAMHLPSRNRAQRHRRVLEQPRHARGLQDEIEEAQRFWTGKNVARGMDQGPERLVVFGGETTGGGMSRAMTASNPSSFATPTLTPARTQGVPTTQPSALPETPTRPTGGVALLSEKLKTTNGNLQTTFSRPRQHSVNGRPPRPGEAQYLTQTYTRASSSSPSLTPTYFPTDSLATSFGDVAHNIFSHTAVSDGGPSRFPSYVPSAMPSEEPTSSAVYDVTNTPTSSPSEKTQRPTGLPTGRPTGSPTEQPTRTPTDFPTGNPSSSPPTHQPSFSSSSGAPRKIGRDADISLTQGEYVYELVNAWLSATSSDGSDMTVSELLSHLTKAPSEEPSGSPITNTPTAAPTLGPTWRPTTIPTWTPTAFDTATIVPEHDTAFDIPQVTPSSITPDPETLEPTTDSTNGGTTLGSHVFGFFSEDMTANPTPGASSATSSEQTSSNSIELNTASSMPSAETAPSVSPTFAPSPAPSQPTKMQAFLLMVQQVLDSTPQPTPLQTPTPSSAPSIDISQGPSGTPSNWPSENPSSDSSDSPTSDDIQTPSTSLQATSFAPSQGPSVSLDPSHVPSPGQTSMPSPNQPSTELQQAFMSMFLQGIDLTAVPSSTQSQAPSQASHADGLTSEPGPTQSQSPTQSIDPTRVSTLPSNFVERVGNNGEPADVFPLAHCKGDCDFDEECAGNLVCWQRDANETVPGCIGGETHNEATDVCVFPEDLPVQLASVAGMELSSLLNQSSNASYVELIGNNGEPANVFPLAHCKGDCDFDEECAGNLVCWQRNANESVPGCLGGETHNKATDVCVSPEDLPAQLAPVVGMEMSNLLNQSANASYVELIGNNGEPAGAFPLPHCKGDCDYDGDCEGTLVCWQRNENEPVPGCVGGETTNEAYDVCVLPEDVPGDQPSTSPLPADHVERIGNDGKPETLFPLPHCKGDCDHDDECDGDLICWQRNANDPVPGCVGGETFNDGTDFCVLPQDVSTNAPT